MQEFPTTVLPLSLLVSRAPTGEPAIGPVFIHWGVYRMPAADILLTTKGDTLSADALAWPTGAAVKSVSLLGREGGLEFANGSGGLTIAVHPEEPGDHAFAFKIVQ